MGRGTCDHLIVAPLVPPACPRGHWSVSWSLTVTRHCFMYFNNGLTDKAGKEMLCLGKEVNKAVTLNINLP